MSEFLRFLSSVAVALFILMILLEALYKPAIYQYNPQCTKANQALEKIISEWEGSK